MLLFMRFIIFRSETWYEFNDTEVRLFDPKLIPGSLLLVFKLRLYQTNVLVAHTVKSILTERPIAWLLNKF